MNCRVCGASSGAKNRLGPLSPDPCDRMLTEFEELRDRGLWLRQCDDCKSLLCDDERRDEKRLGLAYRSLDESYWDNLNSYDGFAQTLFAQVPALPSTPDVWDVGCGIGRLLEQFPAGWRGHGVEPGVAAAAFAQGRGLDVRCGTLESLEMIGVGDLVLLIDTFEHLLNPEKTLRQVSKMLKVGGGLLVLTGAADRMVPRLTAATWYYLRCVGHVTIASRKGLERVLERAGFEVERSVLVDHPGSARAGSFLARLAGNAVRRVLGRPLAPTPMFRDHQLVFARSVATRA